MSNRNSSSLIAGHASPLGAAGSAGRARVRLASAGLALLLASACTSPARALPAEPPLLASPDSKQAPERTTLPIGVGLTASPTSFMLSGALDFPVDDLITVGPSVQLGLDDADSSLVVTGQVKYFLSKTEGSFSVLPYLTAGAGAASIDKENREADSGLVVNIGAGVRYLTGEHYRLGSELRLNYLPDDVAGEDTFFSIELLQVVISF